MLKKILKNTLSALQLPVTRNMRYDLYTRRVLERVLRPDSNCIDVGALDGDFSADYRKLAPAGHHWAFEPIPAQYAKVAERFAGDSRMEVIHAAVADYEGESSFNHVISNPSYSGLKKRRYDRKTETDETITVLVKKLDDVIPENVKIDFIKIDVEGAELGVLKGGKELIRKNRPAIVFEFGKGGSDFYGTGPREIWDFFQQMRMKLYLLQDWLRNQAPLTFERFARHFEQNDEYYFLAHA